MQIIAHGVEVFQHGGFFIGTEFFAIGATNTELVRVEGSADSPGGGIPNEFLMAEKVPTNSFHHLVFTGANFHRVRCIERNTGTTHFKILQLRFLRVDTCP